MTVLRRRRGLFAFDLRGITNHEHRHVIQDALNACDYPFMRIRRAAKVRVPVTVADTSRFVGTPEEIHEQAKHEGASPVTSPGARAAALGLYWLPTAQYPTGRIEVGLNAIGQPNLAREVFLAEVWHCVDYTVVTREQRAALDALFTSGDETGHGWFDSPGGYWKWHGENTMPAFVRAFAPSLPRPLEARQPWAHPVTDEMAARMRAILL